MKTRIFLFAAFLCCIFLTQRAQAQVTSVNYRLVYNVDSCWYDALLIINAGSATTAAQRTQFNSQFSVVVPTGTSVTVARTYWPKVGNATYSSTTPTAWNKTSIILSPAAAPESDFYSLVPVIAPAAHYNNLNSGDTIKLFSLNVSSITDCGSGIHIFENGVDPSSSAAGMQGSDFSNGFTIGGGLQRYNANSTQLHPPSPVLVNALTSCSTGIEIDLTATTSACQTPLTYAWTSTSVNNYTSTSEDVSIVPSTLNDVGDYKVVVTDSLGCKDSLTITAASKPNAGADQTVCAGTVANIAGTAPNTGSWAAQSGNPAGAILGLLPGGTASVTFNNSASGVYRFIYSTTSCSDTMAITVNPKPTVSITGSNSICVGFTTTLSPTTGGTWTSSNSLVATVANDGTVTAVGQGTAVFTFTSSATTCFSTTLPVTVNPGPTVAVTGTPAVCIGSTTTVTPTTGGTWVSSNGAVATVTNAGLVTGVASGSVTLTFTDGVTGCVSAPLTITVTPSPAVTISGPDSICVLTTTTLTPATGGTWASSNGAVASVSNAGLVTGLVAGVATFTWTETSTGCMSLPTDTVWVLPRPTVSLGAPVICVGSTMTLSPNTGGTWVSNNTGVATVNATTGVVTGVSSGTVSFTFTNSTTLCSNTTTNLTVNPRPTVSAGSLNICIGATTNLSPSTGGTWASASTGVATVTPAGLVTGVSAGTSVMTFTETATGCTNTLTITVTARPVVSITGLNEICVGFTTTLSPTTGGTWASTNPGVATVSNAGLVTGISVGTATFVFTSTLTGCPSLPTGIVTVKNKPVVAITGGANLCIGGTTTLSPTTGGTWASSNTGVATVNATTGVVTAVGPGSVTFTFTETGGCVSNPTSPVTVAILPPTSFTGPNNICVGFTTTLSPTTGGVWTSSNPAVATVNNAGLVTGISAGTANFTFTLTATGCTSIALTGTVSPKPTSTLTGPNPICIDSTTTLTASPAGGTWTSSALGIATVTNGGVVTGVSQGTAILVYTSAAGCASDPITSIAIMPRPVVNITGPDEICIDGTTTLSPTSGGTWTSSNPSVATVSNAGVVTGVAIGIATFTFTSSAGCVSAVTDVITVNPKPIAVINGSNSICVGNTTQLSPTTGGSWVSSDPSIATITNGGLVTGVSVGSVTFVYTNTLTGCSSDASAAVTITTGPTVNITGDDQLCIGETTQMAAVPSSAGTWESSNNAIATISPTGLVTAVAQGTVTMRFRDAAGCLSQPSAPITVNGRPTVAVAGSNTVCIGGTTQLSPSTGGTWISNNSGIASVTNGGLVTGVAVGSTTFVFTLTATGCSSLATEPVSVSPAPTVAITGLTDVCVGGTTTLSPSTGGVWVSNNPSVATVTNEGIVTTVGPGKVTFTFTETATGCASASATDTVTVTHCFNPDFNATFVNVSVPGNVRTNDNVPDASTYGPTPVLISSPSGSIPVITVNADGSYTFVANLVGVYRYEVPVCTPPLVSGCPRSELTITVADHLSPLNRPVANVDFATTPFNTAVTLATLANDGCVRVTGCDLAESSVVVSVAPQHGSTTVDLLTGDIEYTPTSGYVGIDTLTYTVCVTGDLSNCATAKQIITVNAPTALNSTVAADDFAVSAQAVAVSGNVKDNDSDAEGDNQTITAINTTVAAGSLVLDTDGVFTFTPVDGFTGPVEFIYETIDDNATPDTAYATLHILVVPDLAIRVRAYLEGALMNSSGTADGRPLMRDNLRVSPFTASRYIPNKDPYKYSVKQVVSGQEIITTNVVSKFTKVAAGTLTKYDSIANPTTVFAVTGQNAIVDWVFIELRSKTSNTTKLATRSGLIQRDGDVVDLDGVSALRFPGLAMDDYYVVVRHLKHLGSMTAAPQTPQQLTTLVNFTTPALATYDKGSTPNGNYTGLAQNTGIKTGFRALWGGDFDANGKVKNDNPNDDLNSLNAEVSFYPSNTTLNTNYDFAYGYMAGDYDMNSKSKFDNPGDDKNMLYAQVFFYPLNTFLLTNFDFLVEQLP